MSATGDAIIEVEHLTKRFPVASGVFARGKGEVHAVEDVSLRVLRGETLGIVGESGCGKSTTARLMLKLLEPTSGTITFNGRDITRLSPRDMRPVRREMQMIFQDPYSSLNPRHTVGQIIGAPYTIHKTEGDTRAMVRELMDRCGMNPEHYNRYPHEFSGGQRQRIGLARALALRPKLIVCDEPVSALDVSIQAQILNLLESLQNELDLTYVFISHDLSVIRQISDRIAVMYLGRIVELADSETVYRVPRHPYTASLLSAVPARRQRWGASAGSASCSVAMCRRPSRRRRGARSIRAARRPGCSPGGMACRTTAAMTCRRSKAGGAAWPSTRPRAGIRCVDRRAAAGRERLTRSQTSRVRRRTEARTASPDGRAHGCSAAGTVRV